MIECKGKHCKSMVYHIDKKFEDKEMLLKDAREFDGNGVFAEFLADILGEAG